MLHEGKYGLMASSLPWSDEICEDALTAVHLRYGSRLPREFVESPSLEIFKTHLDKVLCSLLWVTLLGQGVGMGDPQRSLPTPNFL